MNITSNSDLFINCQYIIDKNNKEQVKYFEDINYFVKKLTDKILQCDPVKELAIKACKNGDPLYGKKGPLQVIFEPNVCKKIGTLGFSDHTNRFIVISVLDKDPIKAMDIIIFEIANLTQTAEYRELQKKAKNNEVNRDEYAKGMSKIEYNSKKLHHIAVQMGIKKLKWPKEMDTFGNDSHIEHKELWNRDKSGHHTQHDKNQYDAIMDKEKKDVKEKEKKE